MRQALLLPALLLTACSFRSPDPVFHTLRAAPVTPATAPRGPALEILPLRLPELLQRPQLVLATGPGTYQLAEGHRWANGLDRELQRALGTALSSALGAEVVAFPDGPKVQAARRLEVEILHCEAAPGNTLAFHATWTLSGAGTPLRRTTRLDEPVAGKTPEALVAAHERVLAALAKEIAVAVTDQP
jgi:hypothetical protein